jgi:hypothetical protein
MNKAVSKVRTLKLNVVIEPGNDLHAYAEDFLLECGLPDGHLA